jgi:uncharacterized protein (UPF0332 family)
MDKSQEQLALYRLENAKQAIHSASVLVAANDYKGAANRSYYGIFHCVRSVLALDNVDFSKHAGVIFYFRKNYIKEGIFDVRLSDIIGEAFDVRSDSDYDDYYVISKEEVEQQIQNAEFFYSVIKQYVEDRINRLL